MPNAPLTKTKHPGIYRRGDRYVVVSRVQGRQRKETVRTLAAALKLQATRRSGQEPIEVRRLEGPTLHDYARAWVKGHQGIRERTRREYAAMLERYVLRHFGPRQKVTALTVGDVSRFVAWLCDEGEHGRRLSDKTIRNVLAPLSACLDAARHDELLDSNPVHRYKLPRRERIVHDEEGGIKALSRDQLADLLTVMPAKHRLMTRLIASTGLRISEAVALERRHLALDGSRPRVKVRQGIVKGELGPPKSKHSRRDVPLSPALVTALRLHLSAVTDDRPEAPVFAALNGRPLNPDNLRNRVLRPAAEEAGVPWAGWHTLRHTYASLHIYAGTNIVQLSRLLGHHSPSFTLDRYTHLMPGEEGQALDLDAELAGGNTGATSASLNGVETPSLKTAHHPLDVAV